MAVPALSRALEALGALAPGDPLCGVGLARAFDRFAPARLPPRVVAAGDAGDRPAQSGGRAARYAGVLVARAALDYFGAGGGSGDVRLTDAAVAGLREVGSDKACGTGVAERGEGLALLAEVVFCVGVYSPEREALVQAVCALSEDDQETLQRVVCNVCTEPKEAMAEAEAAAEAEAVAVAEAVTDAGGGDAATRAVLGERSHPPADENARGSRAAAARPESALREKVLVLEQRLRDAEAQAAKAAAGKPAAGNSRSRAGGIGGGRGAKSRRQPADGGQDAPVDAAELQELRRRAARADEAEAAAARLQTRVAPLRDALLRVDELEAEAAALRDREARGAQRAQIVQAQLDAANARAETLVAVGEALTKDLELRSAEANRLLAENAQLAERVREGDQQITELLGAFGGGAASGSDSDGGESEAGQSPAKARPATRTAVDEQHVSAVVTPAESTTTAVAVAVPATVEKRDALAKTGENGDSLPVADLSGDAQPKVEAEAPATEEEVVAEVKPVVKVEEPPAAPVAEVEVQSVEERAEALDLEAVSLRLERELGVSMPWPEIVEALQGVHEAMKAMDEEERIFRESQARDAGVMDGSAVDAATEADVSRQPESPVVGGEGSQSARTSSGGSLQRAGSGRVPILQDFVEVDMRMEAAGSPRADDFDFAADTSGIREVSAFFGRDDDAPMFDKERVPVPPRRGSSQPSLPTIPEECEGFLEDDTKAEGSGPGRDDSGQVGGTGASDGGGRSGTVPHESKHGGPEVEDNASCSSLYSSPRGSEDRDMNPYHGAEEEPSDDEAARMRASDQNKGHAPSPQSPSLSGDHLRDMAHIRQPSFAAGTDHTLQHPQGSGAAGVSVGAPYAWQGEPYAPVGIPVPVAQEPALNSLVQQLSRSREELRLVQNFANMKEVECADIRKEVALLINEVDSLLAERDAREEREHEIVSEKERMIQHLSYSLQTRTAELDEGRAHLAGLREEVSAVRDERKRLTDEVLAVNKSLSEAARQHEVETRTAEVEIARLTSQLKTTERMARKLRHCIAAAEDETEEVIEERHKYYNELMASLREERRAAEAARDETRNVARMQSEKLAEIHDTARVAAAGREYTVDLKLRKSQRSVRGVGGFLRRIAHRAEPAGYDSRVRMSPVGPASQSLSVKGFPSRPILPR